MAKAKLRKLWKNSYVKTILLGVILLGAVFAFWYGLRVGLRTDYPLLAVASGSMEPTLKVGDLIVVQGVLDFSNLASSPPDYWNIRAVPPNGTIIVFHKPSDPGELIVHRVAEKMEQGGTWYFRTKGDNNNSPDYWVGDGTLNGWVSQSLLVGQVIGVVPWIGNVPLFIRTPSGLLLIVLLFLIILFIEYVPVLSKKAKTEPKEETPAEPEAENEPEN